MTISQKRVSAFIDSQNLYHSIQRAFDQHTSRYDEVDLVRRVGEKLRLLKSPDTCWEKPKIHFYSAMPDGEHDPDLHRFWETKNLWLSRNGVVLRNVKMTYSCEDDAGKVHKRDVRKASGVEVLLAVDLLRFTRERRYDVALVFSQNRYFEEVANEMKRILAEQKRRVDIWSVYPMSFRTRDAQGIPGTQWYQFDQDVYLSCISETLRGKND